MENVKRIFDVGYVFSAHSSCFYVQRVEQTSTCLQHLVLHNTRDWAMKTTEFGLLLCRWSSRVSLTFQFLTVHHCQWSTTYMCSWLTGTITIHRSHICSINMAATRHRISEEILRYLFLIPCTSYSNLYEDGVHRSYFDCVSTHSSMPCDFPADKVHFTHDVSLVRTHRIWPPVL